MGRLRASEQPLVLKCPLRRSVHFWDLRRQTEKQTNYTNTPTRARYHMSTLHDAQEVTCGPLAFGFLLSLQQRVLLTLFSHTKSLDVSPARFGQLDLSGSLLVVFDPSIRDLQQSNPDKHNTVNRFDYVIVSRLFTSFLHQVSRFFFFFLTDWESRYFRRASFLSTYFVNGGQSVTAGQHQHYNPGKGNPKGGQLSLQTRRTSSQDSRFVDRRQTTGNAGPV